MALAYDRYGKERVRVLRLHRDGPRHAVRELSLAVLVEGDFARAFAAGDNRAVVATDTLKNIVQVLAHRHPEAGTEAFLDAVAGFLLERYPQVRACEITGHETAWARLALDGVPHDHAFALAGNGRPFARIAATREGATLDSGIEGFTIMKTTASEWRGFHRDEYRTLPDAEDRIMATSMDATWTWDGTPADHAAGNAAALDAMLRVFASTHSRGVQDTLYRMGEAALAAVPALRRIRLAMPNKHYIPLNLEAFGIAGQDTVFLPTDEPHGQIEALIARD